MTMQFIYDAGTLIGMVDEASGKWRAYDPHNTCLGSFGSKTEATEAIPRASFMTDREAILGQRDKPLRSDAGKRRGPRAKVRLR